MRVEKIRTKQSHTNETFQFHSNFKYEKLEKGIEPQKQATKPATFQRHQQTESKVEPMEVDPSLKSTKPIQQPDNFPLKREFSSSKNHSTSTGQQDRGNTSRI